MSSENVQPRRASIASSASLSASLSHACLSRCRRRLGFLCCAMGRVITRLMDDVSWVCNAIAHLDQLAERSLSLSKQLSELYYSLDKESQFRTAVEAGVLELSRKASNARFAAVTCRAAIAHGVCEKHVFQLLREAGFSDIAAGYGGGVLIGVE